MNKEELIKTWDNFCQSNDFQLNPDQNHVAALADGILINEKKYGLRLCPCRLRDGSQATDWQLICPCNFKIQDNWKNLNRCWCGLFVKK